MEKESKNFNVYIHSEINENEDEDEITGIGVGISGPEGVDPCAVCERDISDCPLLDR